VAASTPSEPQISYCVWPFPVASPARTSSPICATVKPCAIMSVSVQPSRDAAVGLGGRGDGGEGGAWSSGGSAWSVPLGYQASGDHSRPRGHALDRARRRSSSEQARRHRRGRAWTVCSVRHSGKFPNGHVAPLRAGRQRKPLRLLQWCRTF